MKVVFYASEGKKFDLTLAAALGEGVRALGDAYDMRTIAGFERPEPDTDVAVVAGVKGWSQDCFAGHIKAGKHAIIVDKGYTRLRGGPLGTLYWRMSVDNFQPHAYFRRTQRPDDRWSQLGVLIDSPRNKQKGSILFCGSSQKYCNWHGLGDANDYAAKVLSDLRKFTDRELVYRPKPSWGGGHELEGSRYSASDEKYVTELDKAFAVVTFGSNAAFEAILRGVPAFVLGDGIARSLANTKLSRIESPKQPGIEEVRQLAHDVAYCQFTLEEMASGLAWQILREEVERSKSKR